MTVQMSSIHKGYAEVFIYEPNNLGIEGCVQRKAVRTHLDLNTGRETKVNRWFSYIHTGMETKVNRWFSYTLETILTYVPVEQDHMLNGYPTRNEAVQSLVRYYNRHCKAGNNASN